ncbi:hypothetical protein CapIbe_015054 [Capra ibex]
MPYEDESHSLEKEHSGRTWTRVSPRCGPQRDCSVRGAGTYVWTRVRLQRVEPGISSEDCLESPHHGHLDVKL